MISTNLKEQPKNDLSASRGDEPGAAADSAAGTSESRAEFLALRSGCGVYDLAGRALLVLTGGDRMRWLNGMVTNNIRDLAVGQGVYAFLLNPQGRILGDLYAFNRGESIVVETSSDQTEKILATFDHYIIMDDVEVTNVSEQQTALGLAGPKSRAVLNAAGIEVPELQPLQMYTPHCNCECGCAECTVVRGADAKQESYEIWLAPEFRNQTWAAFVANGATPVSTEALEMQRIALGIPRYGQDIRERDLPQETEQAHALNFTKGCYVGQEIVERIRSRGNVHRTFAGFVIEGALPAPGAKITIAGKEVGEITSAALLPAAIGDRNVALGYIRREAGPPGTEVEIGNSKAVVTELPFKELLIADC